MNPTPLKTALAAVTEAAVKIGAATEIFPADLKAAYSLLEEIKKIQPRTEDEVEAKADRIARLMVHVRELGKGLPVVPTLAGDQPQLHRSQVRRLANLERLASQSPAVRALLVTLEIVK